MQFIDLQSQLGHMRGAIDKRIGKVLDHGKFIMGPEVFELEEKLADYVGVKHCISCANGTDALQLSLMALDIGPGDIVFTTSFSFFATAEVIALTGATPYFIDIDIETYNICPSDLESAIQRVQKMPNNKARAVIAVDLFGLPANYPELENICKRYGLCLIEDAAQGFGGAIEEKNCGSFGDIATTSFFPAKPLGCYGDGGAIFTNDSELASTCKSLRVHGQGSHKYENVRIGTNSRLDTIQAAILLEKLAHFDQELDARQQLAIAYNRLLTDKFLIPTAAATYKSAWAQYTVRSLKQPRAEVIQTLQEHGIPTAIYYPIPLHQQKALQDYPTSKIENTSIASDSVFSLPMHGYMSKEQWDKLSKTLEKIQL